MSRQRILYLNHTGRVSGAEYMLLQVLSVVDRTQYEPIVMCPTDGELGELVRAAGIQAIQMPAVKARFTTNPFLFVRYLFSVIATALVTRRLIRQISPRGIHANTVRAAIVATLATTGSDIPVIWHVHDNLPERNLISSGVRLLAFLSRRSHIIGVSRYTTGTFCGRYRFGPRAETLYNCIDVERFPRRQGPDPWFKRELGLPDDAFLCATIGMITPRKRLDCLISAIQLIHQKNPGFPIYLVDVGEAVFDHDRAYRDGVIQRVRSLGLADRIRFVGFRRDIPAVMRSADLVILNSIDEPYGLVVCEAMASGTPVLSACAGGPLEILDNGRYGWLLPAHDPASMADTILDLARNPLKLHRHVDAARERVVSAFSQSVFRSAIASLYDRIFAGRRSAFLREAPSRAVPLYIPPRHTSSASHPVAVKAPVPITPKLQPLLAPQRILYVNHTGFVSGAERMLLFMLNILDRTQYEPIVMCPAEGDLARMVTEAGVRTVVMPAVRARFTANPFLFARYLVSVMATAFATRRLIRQIAPRGIHANTVRAAIVSTLATFGMRTPILWHVHDDLPRHNLISTGVRLLAYFSRRSHIVGVSKYTTGTFCSRLDFGSRAESLHNGINVERFSRRDTVDPWFKRKLGIPDDAFLCATIGITTQRKGLDGLIAAMQLLRDKAPNIYLVEVGDAVFEHDVAYRKAMLERVRFLGLQDRIRFVGYRGDVPAILHGVDLLILNSISDPCALIVCEAMASGTPVLSSNAGGSVEILGHGRFGWVLSDHTPATLAAAILDLSSDTDKLLRFVEVAHKRAITTYSQSVYRQGFADLYARVFPVHNVAVFHDSFSQQGGAERVAEVLLQSFPGAELFTTLTVPDRLTPFLKSAHPHTTWMQWLPFKDRFFRAFFLLYPIAVEHTDLSAFDLVVTSCTGYSKGVRRRTGALHICYCHNPMRWVHRTDNYLEQESFGRWKAVLLRFCLKPLRDWESRAARRPDYYIANSSIVRKRLYDAFGVDATVINPPINTSRFAISEQVEDFYLVLSRLIPYKRIDLAVAACTLTGRKLVVIGDGRDRHRLQHLAGPTVTFLGRVVNDYASRCRALLFTGEEDFGMTPLEVNSAGRPAIAFHAGGATETVIDGLNGIFFNDPTVESLLAAIERFESMAWDPQAIRRHALQYDTAVFQARLRDFVRQVSGQPSGESSAHKLAQLLVKQ